jgi:DNA-dependent RNA polymerase auxiliary subunit epsilon
MNDDKPSVEQLVSVYIKIRDAKEAAKRAFEEREAELNEHLDMISGQILEICKETGADSIKTKYGTAMRSIKSRYWTNDWEAFHKFMLEWEAPDLLEKRIHQSNMKQFLEDNPGTLPAGLNMDSQYTITVRRSK